MDAPRPAWMHCPTWMYHPTWMHHVLLGCTMSYTDVPHPTWMYDVLHGCTMSYMDVPCPIWLCHVPSGCAVSILAGQRDAAPLLQGGTRVTRFTPGPRRCPLDLAEFKPPDDQILALAKPHPDSLGDFLPNGSGCPPLFAPTLQCWRAPNLPSTSSPLPCPGDGSIDSPMGQPMCTGTMAAAPKAASPPLGSAPYPPGMQEFGMTPPKSLIPVCSPCAAPIESRADIPSCTHSPHHGLGAQPHTPTHTWRSADPTGSAVPLHLPTAQLRSGPHPDSAGHVPCVSQRPTAPYAKGEGVGWGHGMLRGGQCFVPVLCAQPGGGRPLPSRGN